MYMYAGLREQDNTVQEPPVTETRQSKATTCTPEETLFFSRGKEELPQAGLEPATFCVLGRHSTN